MGWPIFRGYVTVTFREGTYVFSSRCPGGGFKYLLFSPRKLGKMIQFGWFNQPTRWFCGIFFDASPMDPLGINASTKSRWRAQSIAYLIRFNERTRKAVDHLRVFVSETGNDDSYFFMYAPMKMNIPFGKLT